VGITTKRSGPPVKFDADKAIRLISGYVPGAILRRTAQGVDANGKPFAPYTASYRERLAEMSEDQKIDLRLTGGLMNSVKVREKRITSQGVEVVIAPDTGTSPRVVAADGRAKRTGDQGPPHNVLGYWLHHGTPHMRARPFMGLSPEQQTELNRILAKARLWG
jgi:hypothetical protein